MVAGARKTVILSKPFDAAAAALFAAMTTAPTPSRKKAINTLIVTLKSAGIWSRLDCLWIFAAHDSQAARLNWKSPGTFTLSLTNAPTFTTDRGFTGDGATSGLGSGPNLSSFGGGFSLNDACMGIWCGTDATENVGDFGGVNNAIRVHSGATTNISRANNANTTTQTINPATAVGLTSWSRSNASDFVGFKDGASLGTVSSASSAISNAQITFCFVGAGFSTKRLQAAYVGLSQTTQNHVDTHAALTRYMQAVGAA